MCIADYLIGEATDGAESVITVAAAGNTPIIGANPRRTGIVISPPAANTVWLCTHLDGGVGHGLHIGANDPTLLLNLPDYGQLVRKGWYGISSSGNNDLTVWELFLDVDKFRKLLAQYNGA